MRSAEANARLARVCGPRPQPRRLTGILGDTSADRSVWNHATMRTRLIAVAATLVNRSGRPTLRLPLNWPWAEQFTDTLNAVRALPAPSG